jgi:hypothetical protein
LRAGVTATFAVLKLVGVASVPSAVAASLPVPRVAKLMPMPSAPRSWPRPWSRASIDWKTGWATASWFLMLSLRATAIERAETVILASPIPELEYQLPAAMMYLFGLPQRYTGYAGGRDEA